MGVGIIALDLCYGVPKTKGEDNLRDLHGAGYWLAFEMALLLPVVWSELRVGSFLAGVVYRHGPYHGAVIAVFLIIAPWFVMTLVGCLRIIATSASSPRA